jgi:hypothetical protein
MKDSRLDREEARMESHGFNAVGPISTAPQERQMHD